ncbi:hypothetical protein FH968_00045 [Buttiauxella sp. B2]|uniref:hypothetical protein n=1 Tax=Buttiauxella sp. B2 TaxID=2587812 RepID=UPI00111DF882|nr:hypothetical protein [Buttiauxella sp. B2]TNV22492.1 hypothetical protein FH968_00045 [Buttiauxella sp. B2]
MQINSEQYRAARDGHFFSRITPLNGEPVTLNMPTPRGRRFLPVGNVSEIKDLGQGKCLVRIANLEPVQGIYS